MEQTTGKIKLYNSLQEAEADIPLNKTKFLQFKNQEICLARVAQGLFAVADACPHLGYALSRGTCNYLGEIICPWHSYRFSLETGEECTGHILTLARYPITVTEEGVFLELDGN